jgi:hypothetical protein
MAATNKRLLISESRSNLNRCTPCRGKSNQYDTYASHASPHTPSVCFLRAVPIRGNLSLAINSVGRTLPLPRKRAPDTTPNLAEWSTSPPPSFSPNTAIKAVMKAKTSINSRLPGLPGPYHRHAMGTFNTCSRVPSPRSLTDTCGDYHKGNLGIATTLSPPFPSEGFTDLPNGLTRSPFLSNINIQINWVFKHLLLTHGLSTTRHLPTPMSMPGHF